MIAELFSRLPLIGSELSRLPYRRMIGKWWVVSVAAIGIASGAFGVAPRSSLDVDLERTHAVVPLPLQLEVLEGTSAEDRYVREERVLRGDSLSGLLARLHVSDTAAHKFLRGPSAKRIKESLVQGRLVRAVVTREGVLLELVFLGSQASLALRSAATGFELAEDSVGLEKRVVVKAGIVDHSFFSEADAQGIPDEIASAFADAFSGELDLHRDVRKGDRFSIVFEMFYSNGEPLSAGKILAAEIGTRGKTFQAIYFENEKGVGGFFAPTGRNLRTSFLRSPIEFSRVTSNFATLRLHPVLQVWRAHKGIDYGAPVGTPVRSTGDGVVVFSGWQSGYGKTVLIKHTHNISTLYGHLAEVSQGLREGIRVSQGDVIGLVGMSGLTSGPHLHYEFQVHKQHMDPARHVAQPLDSIPLTLRPKFLDIANDRLDLIAKLKGLELARLE